MTSQNHRDLSEMDRRRIRAGEANKIGLWILLGAVGAALVAGAIYATSYIGTQTTSNMVMQTTGSANISSAAIVPLPRPKPAQL